VNLDTYQKQAMSTASRVDDDSVVVAALGLAGEAGEFADHVKKHIAQGHDLSLAKLDDEAGDILWYLALYAEASHADLSTIAEKNLGKLRARYPEGSFTVERSVNRDAS
jgi:NTP pyrophosphatase (non-canonical NTP hydrolase)